jgi:hypothetical protein
VRPRFLLPVVALLAGGVVAGCGDDPPAVCTSIDELESSLKGLTSLELNGSGVAGLEDQVALVEQDFTQLKKDAKDEYGDQVDAISADLGKVKTSAGDLVDKPSAAAVDTLRSSRDALAADTKKLADDVKSSC